MDLDRDEPPVLVIGAGPTGLTAALELSRLGIAVRIVDQAAGAVDDVARTRRAGPHPRTAPATRRRRRDAARWATGCAGRRCTPTATGSPGSTSAGCKANSTSSSCSPSPRPNGCSPNSSARQGVKVERGVRVHLARRACRLRRGRAHRARRHHARPSRRPTSSPPTGPTAPSASASACRSPAVAAAELRAGRRPARRWPRRGPAVDLPGPQRFSRRLPHG